MYEIRQVIQRLRLGETDRGIARTQRVGRRTVAHIRALAAGQNWLDAASPLPDDGLIAAQWKTAIKEDAAGAVKTAQNLSTVEPYREEVLTWHQQGIAISTLRQALVRKHGFTGSVHALHRFIRRAAPATPAATVMLDIAAGEMAQVDFGHGRISVSNFVHMLRQLIQEALQESRSVKVGAGGMATFTKDSGTLSPDAFQSGFRRFRQP